MKPHRTTPAPPTLAPRKRCAIYTRKSTDEGLDQDYNSLEAQRDAGLAFVASQRHEGWTAVQDGYDDGGYSGGNLDRPALKRLMADIEDGRVDIVVVYKIDRLTRSLPDFAKLVDVFDRNGVSFVSVTQQFNTTTSMGRLTLEHPAVLRAVRARGHRRAHPRQDRGQQGQRHVDGRHATSRVRRRRAQAGDQRAGGRPGARYLPSLRRAWVGGGDRA